MMIRVATIDDADGMSRVLREIIAVTGRERPFDVAFVRSHYLDNAANIRCSVVIDDAGTIIGFQSLIRAIAGNRFDVPEGWGIIGTHVSPRAHRSGVGAMLFQSSRHAASAAGITRVDACIGADNPSGLTYYDAMGFETYRERDGIVQKVFVVASG